MQKDLDTLLLLPPTHTKSKSSDYRVKEPMGLSYMKATLNQNGFESEIINADGEDLSIDQTCESVLGKTFSVLGISLIQRALPKAKIISDEIKEQRPNSLIIAGGFTATLSPETVLKTIPAIDLLVLGEGEETILNIMNATRTKMPLSEIDGIAFRDGESIVIRDQKSKPEIDSLPLPSRKRIYDYHSRKYHANVLGSRGCYGNCTFCANRSFERSSNGNLWRARNPRDIVDEIESLNRENGVSVIRFNDANLFGPGDFGKEHVEKICDQIIQRNLTGLHLTGFCRTNDITESNARKMKEAGFQRLIVGVESGNQEILDRFRKGESILESKKTISQLRKHGIDLLAGFMIFNPYTTLNTLKTDLEFLNEQRIFPVLSKALRIYDKTPIQDEMQSESRLIARNPLEGFHEYLMPVEIASIYRALKTLSLEWFEPLREKLEEEMRQIQSMGSHSNYLNTKGLRIVLFDMESYFLKALISFAENGFEKRDIRELLINIKNRIESIELSLENSKGKLFNSYFSASLSVLQITEKIFQILKENEENTFPENYSWNED